MKIDKALFNKVDSETEKQNLLQELMNERTYKQIALLYQEFVQKYANKRIWFLSPRQSSKVQERKTEQIKKLITIIVDLGVPPEIYIRAQFEQLIGWIKKVNPKLGYVPFASMLTEKAIERFHAFSKRIKNSYGRQDKGRVAELFKTQITDIGGSTARSARMFYNRLKEIGDLNTGLATKELEIMARAGLVSNIYVYCSPLVAQSHSYYLKSIQREVKNKLTPSQKESMKRIRMIVLGVLKDKGVKRILKYV